jgi:hypothetical protein
VFAVSFECTFLVTAICCLEGDAQQASQALLLVKKSRCLNFSAFCRAAIEKKLERLEKQEVVK